MERELNEKFFWAAKCGDVDSMELLYRQGANINFVMRKVFSYTPVIFAAQSNHLESVKWLIEHGADITIADEYGRRPYTHAIVNKNKEMVEYLRTAEPEELHNEEQKLMDLKTYELPQELINFLRSKELRFHVNDDRDSVSYIEFYTLCDCIEVNWKGYKFLDLVSDADAYDPEGFLVWYPEGKCLASADYDHEEFRMLGKWEDFIKTPSEIIGKIWDWD